MNSEYWQKYYADKKPQKPSPFAKFCRRRIPKESIIIDMAAGDMRDTEYLAEVGSCIPVEPNNEEVHCKALSGLGRLRPDILYARWFFHAIDEEEEDRVLAWCAERRVDIMAEYRIIGDKPDDTHTRRLIDPEVFLKKLEAKGYEVKYYATGRGFSKVRGDDPLLARVFAKSKRR
jgi:hypothetical protein